MTAYMVGVFCLIVAVRRPPPPALVRSPSEPDVRQQKQQRLIIRNLNFQAKEEDLAKAFSEFGPLAEVRNALYNYVDH